MIEGSAARVTPPGCVSVKSVRIAAMACAVRHGSRKAPGIVKNRPNTFYSQVRRPTMTTKVGFVQDQELLRPDYNVSFKPGNAKRSQTNYGFGSLQSTTATNPPNLSYNSIPLNSL